MSHQIGSYSPPPRRELYSPPPRWDPLTSDMPESPEPTAEESSASAELHYRSDIYTPPAEPRFVYPGPIVTISRPTPAAGETPKPEAPPRSRLRSICNNQVLGGSHAIGGMIGLAIGV